MVLFVKFAVIIAVCILCYGPSSFDNTNQFVFDDFVAIVRNTDVTNTSRSILESIKVIAQHDFWGTSIKNNASHKSYRPVVNFMFNLEFRYFSPANIAASMKRVNLWLHCAICCIIYIVVRRILTNCDDNIVWLATTLFACHPIHTESVCSVVGRADLLCALLFFINLIGYLELIKDYEQRRNYKVIFRFVVMFAMATLAMLSKEIGIMILPFCAVYDILTNLKMPKGLNEQSNKLIYLTKLWKNVIVRCTTLAIMFVLLTLIRLVIINFESPTFKYDDNRVAGTTDFFTRVMSQQYLYALNFWLLICPDWLCFDWSFGSLNLIENWFDNRIVSIALFYAFLIRAMITGSRNVRIAIALLIIPFLPASGIVRVGFVIAERILYIPSFGYCLLICIGLNRFYDKYRKACNVIFVFICAVFIMRTNLRAFDWMNEYSLFRSAIRVCSSNAKVYYNIGRLATRQNDTETAIEFYKEAIRIYPTYDAALNNLGNIYRNQGDLDTAKKYIQAAINANNEFPAAWMNLGIINAAKRNHEEAIEAYEKALQHRPNYDMCLYNLGNLFLDMGNYSMALEMYRKAIEINPREHRPWANILTYLDGENRLDEVLKISDEALSFLPDDPTIMLSRANAYGKLKQYEKAKELYKKIIGLQPENAISHVNLGVLYHLWDRKLDAIKYYAQAVKLKPSLERAKMNLEKLRKQVAKERKLTENGRRGDNATNGIKKTNKKTMKSSKKSKVNK